MVNQLPEAAAEKNGGVCSDLNRSVLGTAVAAERLDGRLHFLALWPTSGHRSTFETMSGLQILVVSQDAVRARDLEDALRQAGHSVVTQADAASAPADLAAAGLDAAVIDLALPGLDRPALGRALAPEAPAGPPEPLESVERRHILATLLYTGGNKRRAAQILGIARSTLIQKVRRYDLRLPDRTPE